MKAPAKILILQNITRPFARKTTQVVECVAKTQGIPTLTIDTTGQAPGNPPDIQEGDACLIIAVGGDGTIIEAAHRSRGSKIPIAGINAGYLGFLSAFSGKTKSELKTGVLKILKGQFQVEERITIEALGMWAINDIVLKAHDEGGMLNLHVRIGRTAVTQFYGDGIIIATPTGSTAYSLAAGGPVLTQANRSLVLTPICPHSFANRALIVSETDNLKIICPKSNRSDITLCCDGQSATLERGNKLEIKVSEDAFPLVSLTTTNRYSILVEKLGWKPLP